MAKELAKELRRDLSRSFQIDRAKIDPEKRTVELAFSSETPVDRWGENEVLGHGEGEADLARLNSDHPLMLGHNESNPKDQIGVIESARIDGDKVGRAVVRFGKSALAIEVFQDVQDGIRKLVSVGYDHTGIVSSEKDKTGRVTTRYRWQPTHIAIVPVPADMKTGVGRDNSQTVDSPQKPETDNKTEFMADKPVIEIDETKVRNEARADALKTERERQKQIREIANELSALKPDQDTNIRTLATEALNSEETADAFKSRAMNEMLKAKPVKPVLMADLGMDQRDQQTYSILRGIQSCLSRDSKQPASDTLEGQVHAELVKRNIGVSFGGFAVPTDAPVRCRPTRGMQRDLQAGVFGQGGASIATQLVTPIVEILRNRMVAMRLGVRAMAGLEGNVVIPRQTGAGTAYAVSEIAGLTVSNQVLDQIPISPKRVGATGQYSRQLLLQSSIDVENFLRDDLLKVIAIAWDRIILSGQGAADEPLGIMNTPGIGSVVFGATATYAKLVNFKTQVATANADVGEMAFVSTPATEGQLRSVAKLLTGATTVAAVALWEGPFGPDSPDGTVAGFRAASTNQIPNNQVLFGVFSEAIHALWGGYDVIVNPYTLDQQAEVRVTINTFGDVAVRHPQCFCVSADSGAQ